MWHIFFCHKCSKFSGFLDFNECLENPCSPNGECTNNHGSFVCKCKTGFSGNGIVCNSMYNGVGRSIIVFTYLENKRFLKDLITQNTNI